MAEHADDTAAAVDRSYAVLSGNEETIKGWEFEADALATAARLARAFARAREAMGLLLTEVRHADVLQEYEANTDRPRTDATRRLEEVHGDVADWASALTADLETILHVSEVREAAEQPEAPGANNQ